MTIGFQFAAGRRAGTPAPALPRSGQDNAVLSVLDASSSPNVSLLGLHLTQVRPPGDLIAVCTWTNRELNGTQTGSTPATLSSAPGSVRQLWPEEYTGDWPLTPDPPTGGWSAKH